MTQEEKELLLRDLCGRYPYSVKVNVNGEIQTFDSLCDDDGYYFQFLQSDGITEGVNIENIKPYLRPMSSMTEEEYNKYELTFDNVVVYSGHNNNNIHSEHRPTYETFDYLDSIHVDYRGLIEKGLALEAPKDMYKF